MYIITLGEIFVTSKYLKKKKKNTYTKKIPIKKKKKVSIDYFIPSASIYDLDPAGKCKNEPRIPEKTREREEGEEEFQDGTGEKVANRVEKRARSRWYRSGRRLCKRYAISDKWRGRERNRDEERARPLASHRRVYLLLS